jgi:hypothetical protein
MLNFFDLSCPEPLSAFGAAPDFHDGYDLPLEGEVLMPFSFDAAAFGSLRAFMPASYDFESAGDETTLYDSAI